MIVVPHTKLHPATREAVPDARFVLMRTPHSYRELLDELWEAGEAFTLVEHDVVPTRGQLAALDACDRPWCLYSYGPGFWIPVFGCVRFGPALIEALPDVWRDDSWPWEQLDSKFAVEARAAGFRPHWHFPHVHHETRGRWTPALRDTLAAMERELAMLRLELVDG